MNLLSFLHKLVPIKISVSLTISEISIKSGCLNQEAASAHPKQSFRVDSSEKLLMWDAFRSRTMTHTKIHQIQIRISRPLVQETCDCWCCREDSIHLYNIKSSVDFSSEWTADDMLHTHEPPVIRKPLFPVYAPSRRLYPVGHRCLGPNHQKLGLGSPQVMPTRHRPGE